MSDQSFDTASLEKVLTELTTVGEEAVLELDNKLRLLLKERRGSLTVEILQADIDVYRVAVLLASFISTNTALSVDVNAYSTQYELWTAVRTAIKQIGDKVKKRQAVETRERIKEEMAEIVAVTASGSDIPFGYTKLTDGDRTNIFSAIEKIRSYVDQSSLSPRKKDAILKKLSELHQEVAREHTRTERIFGFLMDLAFVSGEMAKRAKPAIDEAKEIARIAMNRRSEQEGTKLPPPEELPQLPAPKETPE